MPEQIVFEDEDAPEPRGRHRGLIRRFLLTSLAVAAMLYVAALAISRTAGFRAIVMERLSKVAGIELTAHRAHWTSSLALDIGDLRSGKPGGHGAVGLHAAHARIHWTLVPGSRWGQLSSCEAEDGSLVFVQGDSGRWQPAALSGAASWLHAVQIPGLEGLVPVTPAAAAPARTPADPERREEDLAGERMPDLLVRLQNMDVEWWGPRSNRLAVLRNLSLAVTPADLAGRKVVHVRFSAAEFDSERSGSIRPVAFECLWCGPRRFLLDCSLGAPPPATPEPLPGVTTHSARP